MTDKALLALLLDYYGAFLTERQREFAAMSADEDMSLAEIAERAGVSRQAVRDSLSKATEQLRSFEEKLRLVERDRKLRAVEEELRNALELNDNTEFRGSVASAAEKLSELMGQ